MWLETEDKTIGGYVDAIISTSSGDHIIDYKTGNIIEKNGDKLCVSETHKIQLQLYAAIYYSAYGIWPISLKINGIDETLYEIDFDKENCVWLLNEARLRINEINSIIASAKNLSEINELLSSPSPENCRFCLYRPACKSYLEMSGANSPADWPRDIIGTIIEKKILGNGLMLIRVADNCVGSDVITVRGLHPFRHPVLNFESTEIAVFSMAYDGSPNNFKEGILTTIYNVN
jgi:CRISPR/Cas system-associated exonuclease Cas4 (RecB family)